MCLCIWILPVAAEARDAVVVQFGMPAGEPRVAGDGFALRNVGLAEAETSTQANAAPTAGHGAQPSLSEAHPCEQGAIPAVMVPLERDAALRRQQYWPLVAAAECRHGLPAGLLDAVVLQESRYHPAALSPAGALGLAQLMPDTARTLGVGDRLDPLANLDGGARFLRAMLDRFGSVSLALAAYNAGPGRVEGARGIPANAETPTYVRNVLSFWTARQNEGAQALRATAELLGFVTTAGSSRTAQ